MRNLILLLISLFSIFAKAQVASYEEAKKLIKDNAYKCSNDEIKPRPLWGDTLISFQVLGKGLFKREDMKAIDCKSTYLELYRSGDPLILTFQLSIKSFATPVKMADIPGLVTSLNEEFKTKMFQYLKFSGVPVDTQTSKLSQLLVDYDLKHKRGLINQDFYRQLEFLTAPENIYSTDILQHGLDGQHLLETMLDIEHKYQDKKVGQAIDTIVKFRDPAVYFHHSSGKLSIAARMAYYGRKADTGKNYPWAKSSGDATYASTFLIAYISEDESLSQKIFEEFSGLNFQWWGKDSKLKEYGICGLIVGKMMTSKDYWLTNTLAQLYKNADCHSFTGIVPIKENIVVNRLGVELGATQSYDLFRNYPEKHSALVMKLAGLQKGYPSTDIGVFLDKSVKECRVDNSIEELMKTDGYSPAALLTTAMMAKCERALKILAKKVSQRDAEMLFTYELKDKPADKQTVAKFLRELATNGIFMSDYMIAPMTKKYGAEIFRSISVAKRVSDPKAQEKLLQAEDSDSDQIVQLKWKDLVIELERSKITDVQQKLIDKIRTSENNDEVAGALREAMIEWQSKLRFSRTAADELRSSIEQFKLGDNLLTSLANAKSTLDQTLTKGGRPAIYNEKSTSVLDPIINGRAQCNAGTDFMLLHSSKKGFDDTNEWQVVVFQPKHILPGVIQKNTTGKIDTIESTVNKAGRATIEAVAGKWPLDRRVVLADDYLVAKILGSAMKDRAKNADEFSARAEKILGVKQGDISPKKQKDETRQSYADALNESSFSFGDADIPQGDVVRQDMDVVPQNLSGVEATRIAAPRTGYGSRLSRFKPTKQPEGAVIGSFKHKIEEYDLIEIPSAQVNPIEHIGASIQREYLYGLHKFSTNIGDPQAVRFRVENVLRKLTPAQLNILQERVAKSRGAIVDVIVNKQSNLRNLIESPRQQRIFASRELVAAYLENYSDKFVGGFAGYYKNQYFNPRMSPDAVYPDCSIESEILSGICDEKENYSTVMERRQKFQEHRKTKKHQDIVKFRVLLQDTESDMPYGLDIVMDVIDDGDFTILFEPILSPEYSPGEWRRRIPKNKGGRGTGTGVDQEAPAQPAPAQKEDDYGRLT